MNLKETTRTSVKHASAGVGQKRTGIKRIVKGTGKVGEICVHLIKTIAGAILFYFAKNKKLVFLISSTRSGSTLLKALIAEAPDTSNIPEFDFNSYYKCNKYRLYFDIFFLSNKPIIVLKDPAAPNDPIYPYIPFARTKVIILLRNPFDTIKSIKRMQEKTAGEKTAEKKPNPKTTNEINEKLAKYWCDTYEKVFRYWQTREKDCLLVKYEDLLEKPIEVTKIIFSFIESSQPSGVDTYANPKRYDWQWGNDDGGEKIVSLKIQKPMSKSVEGEEELLIFLKNFTRCSVLRLKLGYPDNWLDFQ